MYIYKYVYIIIIIKNTIMSLLWIEYLKIYYNMRNNTSLLLYEQKKWRYLGTYKKT